MTGEFDMTVRFALILAAAAWFVFSAPALAASPAPGFGRPEFSPLFMKVQDDRRGSAHRDREENRYERREDGRGKMGDGRNAQGNGDVSETRRRHMREKFENLPPEEQQKVRERVQEHRARREEMKEKLMAMPPEERKEKMKELRERFGQDHEAFRKERKEKFEERWKNATPEQKEKFCGSVRHKCTGGDGDGYGCKAAQEACGYL